NMFRAGRDLETAEVGAAKTNTGIRCGWLEGKSDLIAGMKADSGAGNRSSNRPLLMHQVIGRIGDSALTVASPIPDLSAQALRRLTRWVQSSCSQIPPCPGRCGIAGLCETSHKSAWRLCGDFTTPADHAGLVFVAGSSKFLRNCPVTDFGFAATCSGVPAA